MMKYISFILALLFATVGSTQETWNLQKCIAHAIENSYDVYQSNIELKGSALTTKLSEQEKYPSLSAGSNIGWNFGRSIDPTTNEFLTTTFFSNGYSLNTGVLLYDGGRMKSSIRQNKIAELAALADKDGVINRLTLDVIASYFEILFAQDNYGNGQTQLKTIVDQIDQMNKLVEAGSRARFEIYDLEAQQADFEQQLTIAQNRIDLAFLSLKGLINLPSDFDLSITTPQVDQEIFTVVEVATLDEIYEKALHFHPSSRGLDYRIEAATTGIDVAKSSFYPQVSFGGSLSTNFSNQGKEVDGFTTQSLSSDAVINGSPSTIVIEQVVPTLKNSPYFNQVDNNFGYGFGFNVNIPIYSNYTSKANLQRAKLNLENLQVEKSKNDVNLKNLMMQLLTDARAAQRSLTASEKTLTAREVSFENAEKRYSLGAINTYEFIGVQDQFNIAKTNFLLSKYDYMLKVKLLDYYQGYPVKI